MFESVLIANRGEIALRIARTCREMGIRTIAVCSTEDRGSAVTRFADEVVQIGPASSRRSYLYPPAIVEAARRTGAEAIHPGYGFLSEDADFAEICRESGLTFVGPPPDVLARVADKACARGIVAASGVPVLPGSTEAVSVTEAAGLASRIGFPVLLKACAGGGGRGITVVREARELASRYREAQATAEAVFGDGRLYLEKFVEAARHVEVQVLADAHGNAVHLGERDCSVQRRHQKLIEETPVPGVPREDLDEIAGAAVRATLAVGYVGLVTFEFLLADDGTITFIEMNCRIQVEHPVTEMVTGLDLVRHQLRVAAGYELDFGQQDIVPRGAAVECRVNAEDPDHDFRPTPGVLEVFDPPGGPFTRVDGCAFPGLRISAHYDPLIAKIVTWAPDREEALIRMDRALSETRVRGPGVVTGVGFLRQLIADPGFRHAKHTTSLIAELTAESPKRP